MVWKAPSQWPPKKPSLLRDLGWSAVTPLLFAAFSLFSQGLTAERVEKSIAPQAQANALMLGLACVVSTSLVALVLIAPQRRLRQQLFSLFRHDLAAVMWLNFWSALGLPLWIAAITIVTAAHANWIDMGLAPVFTFVLALFAPVRSERSTSWLTLASIAFSIGGVALVIGFMVVGAPRGDSAPFDIFILGVAIAIVSSAGTVGAGKIASTLQAPDRVGGGPECGPVVVLFARNILAMIILAALFPVFVPEPLVSSTLSRAARWDYAFWVFALSVVPNFLWFAFVKRRKFKYSGIMWSFMPIFTTLLAVAGTVSFSLDKTIRESAATIVDAFEAANVPLPVFVGATVCVVISYVLMELGDRAEKRRQALQEASAPAPA